MGSKLIFGVSAKNLDSKDSFPALLDLESRFKFTHSTHAATYLSLKNSIDGWRILFGFKLAGLKIHLPIYIIGEEHSVSTDVESDTKSQLTQAACVLGVFLLGSGLMRWWGKRQEE